MSATLELLDDGKYKIEWSYIKDANLKKGKRSIIFWFWHSIIENFDINRTNLKYFLTLRSSKDVRTKSALNSKESLNRL